MEDEVVGLDLCDIFQEDVVVGIQCDQCVVVDLMYVLCDLVLGVWCGYD